MSVEADINAFAFGHESAYILGTKAIAHSAQTLDTLLALQPLNRLLDDRVDAFGAVVLEPSRQRETFWSVHGDCVALERIWNDCEVAIGSKLVSNELNIADLISDHIRNDQDGVCRGLFWFCNVG